METNVYQFAGVRVGVASQFSEVHSLCAAYRVPAGDADFSVAVTAGDIEFERERAAREDEVEGIGPRRFSDAYLETLAVYRKIAERMPAYGVFLLHGSCVAVDGVGYLFTAKSGTGKSTHTRLWRELLGDRAVMVNDDKPLLRIDDGRVSVCGTPWAGKHGLQYNGSVPLRALCILERGRENAIRPVTAEEAYPMLLQQTYRPIDGAALAKTLTLLDALTASVTLWRLSCNMDMDAARLAYDAMKG